MTFITLYNNSSRNFRREYVSVYIEYLHSFEKTFNTQNATNENH